MSPDVALLIAELREPELRDVAAAALRLIVAADFDDARTARETLAIVRNPAVDRDALDTAVPALTRLAARATASRPAR